MAAGTSPAKLKIREEVAALKRERTIAAATEVFYDKGYDKATLDDVAERLGVTKPFIYSNFGSKGELLAEICARGVQPALAEIESVLALGLAPGDSLRVFAPRYVTAVLRSQKNIAVYIREEKNLAPEDARRLAEMRRQFFGKVESLLELGAAQGDFKVDDARIAALALAGAVSWSAFWYRPDARLTLDEIAAEMTKALLGIAGCDLRPAGASAVAAG